MKSVKVLSVNISEKKGTAKSPVPSLTLSENGAEGDAHSGPWNRQVSLLGIESIRRYGQEAKRAIGFGGFAENITTEGMELWRCQPLDRFMGDGFGLEVTQIGKECHGNKCSVFKETGNCVMPKEGIFARVVDNRQSAVRSTQSAVNKTPVTWNLKPETTLIYQPKIFYAHIVTLSDRAFRGEYEDKSGPRIRELLQLSIVNYKLSIAHSLLPDDPGRLKDTLKESIAAGADFIFTTGGTGIGPRDFTVDVVHPMLDKEIPGIMEMIRIRYGSEKPNALLSRSIAGAAGKTLIFTLPGSVKAVGEYIEEILKSLMHMVYMLHGLDTH